MEPIPLADFSAVPALEDGFPNDPDLERLAGPLPSARGGRSEVPGALMTVPLLSAPFDSTPRGKHGRFAAAIALGSGAATIGTPRFWTSTDSSITAYKTKVDTKG